MQTINLKPLHHRGQEVIGIYFKSNADLNLKVRRLPFVKWSQTNKCWYVPLNAASYKNLVATFEAEKIDSFSLKTYLAKRKQVTPTPVPATGKNISKTITSSPAWKLSNENLAALERYIPAFVGLAPFNGR